MSIINLTQHPASPEQIAAGVVDLDAGLECVKSALNFKSLPDAASIRDRAALVASAAVGHEAAMIGGALWLMGPLAEELRDRSITPLFAFSRRESVEKVIDGQTVKTSAFRHVGFVPAI